MNNKEMKEKGYHRLANLAYPTMLHKEQQQLQKNTGDIALNILKKREEGDLPL